jgi:hypothetical protein
MDKETNCENANQQYRNCNYKFSLTFQTHIKFSLTFNI